MQFTSYVMTVIRVKKDNPSWREGQTAFNVLREHRPDLSKRLQGTELNPFYKDKRLPAFYDWLGEHWDDDTSITEL